MHALPDRPEPLTAPADFAADAYRSDDPADPSNHRWGCHCALHGRRRFAQGAVTVAAGAALAGPSGVLAREGVDVGGNSRMARLVPAAQVEQAADQNYRQMLQQAASKRALAGPEHPQLIRLRAIADRIIPLTPPWNERARQWKWEVNLIGSPQINAFCMPGGKIAFYFGILDQLRLDDDEVAMIMGHEAAHALREHARERMAKGLATRGALEFGAAIFGLGDLGRMAAGMGEQLLSLRFSRDDETEADLVGLELAARAGYNPRAGVTLWQKMTAANKGAPPQWLSTHPAGDARIREIEQNLPKVEPLFARAPRPAQRFGPPERRAPAGG